MHWAKAGHELVISSRHPEELQDLAKSLGPKVRAASALIQAKVSRRRIRRSLEDLRKHLPEEAPLSGIHFVLSSNGPTRILSTGGIRYWNDGRDVPDVMLAIFDYPKTASHPAFNLFLKINFAAGSGEESRFQFVGQALEKFKQGIRLQGGDAG